MERDWIITPDSHPAYHATYADVKLEDGELHAAIKWDGCIHLYQGDDKGQLDGSRYIHICDLDQFIADLQSLRKFGKEHFAPKYPEWPALD